MVGSPWFVDTRVLPRWDSASWSVVWESVAGRADSTWMARECLAGKARLAECLRGHIPTSSRNLLANPFNCNCQLAWLGDWLRKRKIVTGNPRCQNPDFLRQIPLQDVAFPDFRCEEGNSCPATTTLGGRGEGELGQAMGMQSLWHAPEGRG